MVASKYPGNELLVLIPTHNEERTLKQVIKAVLRAVPLAEILVVDDGSTDGTCEILESFPGVSKICHGKNLGYGATLRDGFEFAIEGGFERVVTLDADLQHPPSWIGKFLEALEKADVVSGSRYLPDSPRLSEPPQARRIINRIITCELNRRLGLSISDAFCGFKAYRRKVLEVLNITEPGYGMPLQVWVQVALNGFRILEIPVPLIYPDFSRSFGPGLDSPLSRLRYYLDVLEKEMKKWKSRCLSSARTLTMEK